MRRHRAHVVCEECYTAEFVIARAVGDLADAFTRGFAMPRGDTPPRHQTVTDPPRSG